MQFLKKTLNLCESEILKYLNLFRIFDFSRKIIEMLRTLRKNSKNSNLQKSNFEERLRVLKIIRYFFDIFETLEAKVNFKEYFRDFKDT